MFGHHSFSDRVKTGRSLRTPRDTWSELCSSPLCPHVIVLGVRVPANTEFRKRRGIEPGESQSNDGREAYKDVPHVYIDFSVIFLEKPRPLMGRMWSSLVQFSHSSYPASPMSVKDPPFCQFTPQPLEHHHRKLTLLGEHTQQHLTSQNIFHPKHTMS